MKIQKILIATGVVASSVVGGLSIAPSTLAACDPVWFIEGYSSSINYTGDDSAILSSQLWQDTETNLLSDIDYVANCLRVVELRSAPLDIAAYAYGRLLTGAIDDIKANNPSAVPWLQYINFQTTADIDSASVAIIDDILSTGGVAVSLDGASADFTSLSVPFYASSFKNNSSAIIGSDINQNYGSVTMRVENSKLRVTGTLTGGSLLLTPTPAGNAVIEFDAGSTIADIQAWLNDNLAWSCGSITIKSGDDSWDISEVLPALENPNVACPAITQDPDDDQALETESPDSDPEFGAPASGSYIQKTSKVASFILPAVAVSILVVAAIAVARRSHKK
jgi:hypothetical protein